MHVGRVQTDLRLHKRIYLHKSYFKAELAASTSNVCTCLNTRIIMAVMEANRLHKFYLEVK